MLAAVAPGTCAARRDRVRARLLDQQGWREHRRPHPAPEGVMALAAPRKPAADALLLDDPTDVAYLVGSATSRAALLLDLADPDADLLVVDARYAEAVRADLDALDDALAVRVARGGAAAALDGRPGRVVAVDATATTLAAADRLRSAGADVVGVPGPVAAARAVKEPAEVAVLTDLTGLAAAALDDVLHAGVPAGTTEAELARRLDDAARRRGADGPSFPTICASGPHAAQPHHAPCDRPITRGDLVVVDWGVRRGGYCSDTTRTLVVGQPAAWQVEVHAAVRAAQERGRALLRTGAAPAGVDAAAWQVLADAGLGAVPPDAPHGLGHGVGLAVHEPPWVTPEGAGTVEGSTTVTVEPGAYLPGRGGVRVEDLCLVGPDGAHPLVEHDRGLLVVAGPGR